MFFLLMRITWYYIEYLRFILLF